MDKPDTYGKRAADCMQLMQTDAPQEMKLEAFRQMDKLYPGRGWAEEGAKLKRDLDKANGIEDNGPF